MTNEDVDDATLRINPETPTGGAPHRIRPPPPPPRYARAHLISPPPSPPPPPMRSHHGTTKSNPRLLSFFLQVVVMVVVISLFLLFVGFAAIVLLHICIAGGALQRRRRRSLFPNSIQDSLEFGDRLSPKDLQKLPCFNYGAVVEGAKNRDCGVCLEGFRERECCRVLPGCKHVFHANCVDAWLIKVPACPNCRATVELGLGVGVGSDDYREVRALYV